VITLLILAVLVWFVCAALSDGGGSPSATPGVPADPHDQEAHTLCIQAVSAAYRPAVMQRPCAAAIRMTALANLSLGRVLDAPQRRTLLTPPRYRYDVRDAGAHAAVLPAVWWPTGSQRSLTARTAPGIDQGRRGLHRRLLTSAAKLHTRSLTQGSGTTVSGWTGGSG